MAGTRRRSRASDMTHPNQHRRSRSDTTSIIEETAVPVSCEADVVEGTEDASPRPDTPINRSVIGFCKHCGSNIGEYYNSWHKITGSYYVPALLGSYRSLLQPSGKQKAASRGTVLESCTIQPLSCPASNASSLVNPRSCVDFPLGFVVVDAPVGKKHFRGRDFFKLGRIELRCESSPNNSIVVEPREDTAPEILTIDDSNSETSVPPLASTENAMEVDSRPSTSPYAVPHHNHTGEKHEHHLMHHPIQPREVDRQPLLPPPIVRSPTTLAPLHHVPQKTHSSPLPSVSPAVGSNDITSHSQPFHRDPRSASMNRRDFTSGLTQLGSPAEAQKLNGMTFPRSPSEVSLDAIERLQTQISQNSGALAAHTRDIRRGEESFQQLEANLRREFATQVQRQTLDIQRVDEAVARLHLEMQGMRQAVENVSHELTLCRTEIQRGVVAPPGQPGGVTDAALELMAQQLAVMSHKTSEVDNLRVTVEIMKKKIHYLEQGDRPAKVAPASQPHAFQAPHGPAPSQPQLKAPLQATPAATPRSSSPTQTPSNPSKYRSNTTPSSSAMLDVAHRPEPVPSQSIGWASINTGAKRAHMSAIESSREGSVHVPGSPKRQKLAATVTQTNHDLSGRIVPRPLFEPGDAERLDRLDPSPASVAMQHATVESISAPQAQQIVQGPYGTQDEPSDESWRLESPRAVEHRPRGRGRGGGPGSRGGRPRKSLPSQVHHMVTPEWERDEWHGVRETQTGPDIYYNHVRGSGRGIARRGSGGGGRGGYAQSDRAASLGSQGVSPGYSMGSPNDPYAHTKKTRTKPIRNADGVLIRKDGRPDMRSQSSAANLRRVHARKEGEHSAQGSPTRFTPTDPYHAASADVPNSPSLDRNAREDQDAPSSVQRKHSAIMGKMFPSGLDESRRQNDYAHQVFEEDRDHIAHRRNQSHHNVQAVIKEELLDHNSVATEMPRLASGDMERRQEDDLQDHERQTPSEEMEQFHNVPKAQSTHDVREVVIPETQAANA